MRMIWLLSGLSCRSFVMISGRLRIWEICFGVKVAGSEEFDEIAGFTAFGIF